MGFVGLLAVFVLLWRGIDRRAGAYGVVVLATTPLWFGAGSDVTPMAASVVSLAAGYVALVDGRTRSAIRIAAGVFSVAAAAFAARRSAEGIAAAAIIALGLAAAGTMVRRFRVAGVLAAFAALALVVCFVHAGRPPNGTFEAPIAHLAYALAPWSPLVPFALVRRPRSPAQLAAGASAVAALVVHAGLAPSTVFSGAPFIAVAVAAMTRQLDDDEQTSSLLAAAVFTIGALVVRDVGLAPERILTGVGAHFDKSANVPALATAAREMRYAMWIVLVGAVFALLVSRAMLGIRSVRFARGALLLTAGIAAGLVVRAKTWPALVAALSPKAAFDAYAEKKHDGDPIAALGVAGPTGSLSLRDSEAAAAWLADAHDERRFLAVRAPELARLNGAFRAKARRNVPVVAGASNAILLAVDRLAPDEKSESPLDAVVRSDIPPDLRPVDAVLGDGAIELVGWQVPHASGRKQTVSLALRVHGDAPLRGHCTFLHVDHVPTRFTAEHKEHPYPVALWRDGDVVVETFEIDLPAHFGKGTYPISWGVGVLPCEDDRRMHVTRGPRDGSDRIALGRLEVR